MDWLRQFLFRIRSSFRRRKAEAELKEELQTHLEFEIKARQAEGLSEIEARQAALRRFGGWNMISEECRAECMFLWLEQARQDVRYSLRSLRKSARFSALVVLVLAIGIGANSAIFSVVRAMLLMPLPYRDSAQLVFIWLEQSSVKMTRGPLSSPDLRDLRESSKTISDFAGIWASNPIALTDGRDPEQLRGAFVTPNFFQVLGANCALGRVFRDEDSRKGALPTILLGWSLFERRFGGDPSLIGRQIPVNGQSTTVIGVMPKNFRLLLPPDASVPDHLQAWQPMPEEFDSWPRGSLYLRVIGRLQQGATLAQARGDIAAIAERISRETGSNRGFNVVGLKADDVREMRGPLLALFGGIAILLAIACVNVACLLVVRAAARARETAVRLAVGATRIRLACQCLIEGFLLTMLGAAGAVWLSFLALHLLLIKVPEPLSRISNARIDLTVLSFTLAISIAWGLIFSVMPLLELWKVDAISSLQKRFAALGRHATPGAHRIRRLLVVVQVSLSVVLLVGAGLLTRTFLNLRNTELGFRAENHFTFRVALPEFRYPSAEAMIGATKMLQERLAAIPGVISAGAISHLPFDDLPNWALTYSPSRVVEKGGAPFANARAVTPGLLETLGVQLTEGRHFTDDDQNPNNLAVIIDDVLARRISPQASAVGQEFLLGQQEPNQRATVIGVVRHLKMRNLVADTIPQIFLPYRAWQRTPMTYVLNFDGATRVPSFGNALVAGAIANAVRAAVAEVDPHLPIYELRAMQTYVEDARAIRRFTMLLAVWFASAALALTCIGVYGVIDYSVAQRKHEFAIRRALGAGVVRVIRHVLKEGLLFALFGGLIGVATAVILARFLEGQLVGVQSYDPLTFGVAGFVIVLSVLAASFASARKVAGIDPANALRSE